MEFVAQIEITAPIYGVNSPQSIPTPQYLKNIVDCRGTIAFTKNFSINSTNIFQNT